MDTTGILNDYPYVTIKRYVNGTLYTVEKRKVDAYNSILANLVFTRTYQVLLGNEITTYQFGDLTMTAITGVQLVIRGVDFPMDSDFLVMYKYVRIYGYRENETSLIINYQDTKSYTNSVEIQIYLGSIEVYNCTLYTDSFSLEWNEAEPYRIGITVEDGTRFEKEIDAAAFALEPTFDLAVFFAIIGTYVGIIPVMIGLLWLPFIKKISKQKYHFFLALTVGLLLFLGSKEFHVRTNIIIAYACISSLYVLPVMYMYLFLRQTNVP